MRILCEKCESYYNDEFCWTVCPHPKLDDLGARSIMDNYQQKIADELAGMARKSQRGTVLNVAALEAAKSGPPVNDCDSTQANTSRNPTTDALITPGRIDQRVALRKAFMNLCGQYEQIGKQLVVISTIISPFLNGQQELVPPLVMEEADPQKTKSKIIVG